jgi:very-short-patch-repair endonuclease
MVLSTKGASWIATGRRIWCFDVIRFSNEEVRRDIDAVCERILRIAKMEG